MRQEVLDKARDDPHGTPARLLDAAEEVLALERQELHLLSIRQVFRELSELGVGTFRDLLPGAEIDAPAAIHVVASAFIAAIADVDGQEDFLGGSVFTSRPACERLRAELRRMARAIFKVSD